MLNTGYSSLVNCWSRDGEPITELDPSHVTEGANESGAGGLGKNRATTVGPANI